MVNPGTLEVPAALDFFKLLMMLDLPTFGYPITPTVTFFLNPFTKAYFLIISRRLEAPTAFELDNMSFAIFFWTDFLKRVLDEMCYLCLCVLALNKIVAYSRRR